MIIQPAMNPRNLLEYGVLFLFIYLFIFVFFRAAPAAYGGSQARGLIGIVAAGVHQRHSNARSQPQLRQHRIPNPLSEARDGTCSLMVPSWIVSAAP